MATKHNYKKLTHSNGKAITLRHHQSPYSKLDAKITSNSHKEIAKRYLSDNRSLLSLTKDMLITTGEKFKNGLKPEGSRLKLAENKVLKNTRILAYQYSFIGLNVWKKGVNVKMYNDRPAIVSSSSNIGPKVTLPYLEITEKNASSSATKKTLKTLNEEIGKTEKTVPSLIKKWARTNKSKFRSVRSQRAVIFQFDREDMFDREHSRVNDSDHPHLEIETDVAKIKDGSYRVCVETFFELEMPVYGPVNWKVMIDVATNEVLYIRCSFHAVDGLVFPLDPERLSGNASLTPASPATDLDPLRVSVTLEGLNTPAAGDPQALDGEYITISDDLSPNIAPPTEPVGDDFDYSSIINDFAAVNAYYHMDSLYRMVDDFGFDVSTYFAGTSFPIPVDHRGLNGSQNAFHSGNDSTGSTIRFGFGLLASSSIGYAILRAACAHEFAHSCLQNNINDGVFSFCHGFGDALGVILCDPESQAGDRFVRSPFMTSGAGTRRHDRDPAAGWAWGGTRDAPGAQERRQIMSSSLFRAYQCTGGDSTHGNPAVQLARRQFASRYMSFLLIGAVGTLTATSPPTGIEDFETAIMDLDTTNADFEGHPGGAFHKVIRWAFEKQGLHKLPGDPVDGEGAAPEVDVYINDGRDGEYEFRRNFWNTTDIWSAQVNDSTVGHQTPIVGVTNYFFVKVKNRGQATANNLVVKAYQCRPGTGLVWPADWTPMDTPELSAGNLDAGDEVIVGPFEWTPTTAGHECILASVSCDEDTSNADTVLGDIPHWRLVPFDNNIAQRNVSPEEADSDILIDALTERSFWVNNPYDRVVNVELEIDLPDLLRKNKWEIRFTSHGHTRFQLPPKGERKITFNLKKGLDFNKKDVPKEGANIDIITSIDNLVVGGMTYRIDPDFKSGVKGERPGVAKSPCITSVKELLECMDSKSKKLPGIKMKEFTITIKCED